ncbi:MAG: hypothetical protein M1818_003505 [Claussenomyces sp. TS43310]|nr:MAG: hypothetical protein M1818_003505 [Claussenomyces sp. TS43310]
MDAKDDEGDVQLQRASSELLSDFENSAHPFFWTKLADGTLRVRRRVPLRETNRLVALLEPFQELPQLLDPHLQRLIPLLADAFLEYLRSRSTASPSPSTPHLLTSSTAVCRLLYTFCKIRGEKIIVRFFSAEVKNLEALLSLIEANDEDHGTTHTETVDSSRRWSWEERYISLLWLSHLLLAPFDLATISSTRADEILQPNIGSFAWPANLPGVTLRAVPIAIKYLASAGKERDAAKVLLVRISMRKDMQELGLLDALVQWALSRLQSDVMETSSYYYIGILSYLAGVLVSSTGTADMDPYLMPIFQTVQQLERRETAVLKSIYSSALARKTVVKVLRALTVLLLRGSTSATPQSEISEMVEGTISHLLEALSDNDTPVRLAASKALSVITLKLAPVMASQVVDAVLDSLRYNVLWEDKILGSKKVKVRDLSAVNPLEWHGLVLTLSHLLYRRSPPPESLPDILHALLIALSFEKRSTSGSSIGSNVRDAACFGIWALARQYSTVELQSVKVSSVLAARHHEASSIMQVLATELVVSASLDPAGNIRRGASAALQEFIGRHPDTVDAGISLVQVVDYHAVALRSRAISEVAPQAASLSIRYRDAILNALLGWRGVGDSDPALRRQAAAGIGHLAAVSRPQGRSPWDEMFSLVTRIEQQLNSLESREVDERHGLLLSMASIISSMTASLDQETSWEATADLDSVPHMISDILQIIASILNCVKSSSYRRPELTAEGSSRIISAICPVLVYEMAHRAAGAKLATEEEAVLLNCLRGNSVTILDHANPMRSPNVVEIAHALFGKRSEIVDTGFELLPLWLLRPERDVHIAATQASADLTLILDHDSRADKIETWTAGILENNRGRAGQASGYLSVLATIFTIATPAQQGRICEAFLHQGSVSQDVENKVVVLQCLLRGSVLKSHGLDFVDMICEGLDDYTSDSRGDIGSLVRIEALKAAGKMFDSVSLLTSASEVSYSTASTWLKDSQTFGRLYGRVLRLSCEKLDKVRTEAQTSLLKVFQHRSQRDQFATYSNSSLEYFRWLLNAQTHDWLCLPFLTYQPDQWMADMIEGYVSSADTGSAGLVRVSRAALVDFCEDGLAMADTKQDQADETSNCEILCQVLHQVAKKNMNNDRVLVPTLEVMGFLFDAGIMQQSHSQWRALYLLVQKAHYKTANVRKLEAAVKVYGGLLQVYPEAVEKLASMLLHPYPNVRNQVADMVFVTRGVGKGVDWTKAKKDDLKNLKMQLG